MNIAIVFAKGPEKGKRNINMYLVKGHPLIYYSINAALNAKSIERVFVSTNNKDIMKVAEIHSCVVINRPEKLSGETISMGKIITYTVKTIIRKYNACKNFVILSGNTAMISPYLIERSLEVLEKRKDSQSVITAWKSRHDHPRYALCSKDNKFVKPFLEKNTKEEIYFHDGGVCAIRKEIIDNVCFQDERWWMKLPNCVPLVRPWPTGRDVHNSYALGLARWWLQDAIIDTAKEVG